MSFLIVGLLVVLVGGCAGEGEPQEPREGLVPDTALVVTDDPELAAMARELLPDLARRAGLELRKPVRLARRSRADLERYLEAKLDDELSPEEARWMTESYALLGLIPDTLGLRRLLLDVYTEQVAGFYDPDSTALFILEDQSAEDVRTVLVHELVHAVQDQTTDLDSLTARERGNDRQMAAQAAIEGHATLVMLEYLTELARGSPVDLSDIPDFSGRIRPLLEGLGDQYPALAGAPEVVRESLLFPYLEGAGFVQALWRREEGRPPPFGDFLPRSTEHVLRPQGLLGEPMDTPVDLELSVEEGAEVRSVYQDGLGEVEVRILLRVVAGREPPPTGLGWGGDRFALLEEAGGEKSLAWYTLWDDDEARDTFLEALEGSLEAFPVPATLESVRVGGHPGAALRLGGAPALDVAVRNGGSE